jgi:predicted metal-dependent hydrolase
MSTANAYLTVRGIDIDVVYKDIKNLHIGVYPPMGRVRVAAPIRLDDDQVRLAVIHRLPWIRRQREELQAAQRQSEREMVTGESHYVWGKRHRLKVIERPGRAHLEVEGERLLLYVPVGATAERRRELRTDPRATPSRAS